MKKLNRKGFTLVELLAVIIILAIVVGITIPAVLTTINNTRDNAFGTAVSSVADWIDREYAAYQIGNNTIQQLDSTFESQCITGKTPDTNGKITCTVTASLLTAAGVKSSNFTTAGSTITINTKTGRSCVTLKGSKTGDYQVETTKTGGVC